MALIVEDGTGLSNADSYQSLANADIYATNYGLSNWNALEPAGGADDSKKEVALRNATLAIDSNRIYLSEKLNDDQALEFPRADENIGMPQKVRDAAVILADLYLSGVDLYAVIEVLSEISAGVGRGAVMESKKYATPFVVDSTNRAYLLLKDYVSDDPNSGVGEACIFRS